MTANINYFNMMNDRRDQPPGETAATTTTTNTDGSGNTGGGTTTGGGGLGNMPVAGPGISRTDIAQYGGGDQRLGGVTRTMTPTTSPGHAGGGNRWARTVNDVGGVADIGVALNGNNDSRSGNLPVAGGEGPIDAPRDGGNQAPDAGGGDQPPGGDQAGDGGTTAEQDLDSLYQDLVGRHQGQWGEMQKSLQAQQQLDQRRAANINAQMGRNIGGGFAAMAAQANLGAQQRMHDAFLQHQRQGIGLEMDVLGRRETRDAQTSSMEHELKIANINAAGNAPPGSDPFNAPEAANSSTEDIESMQAQIRDSAQQFPEVGAQIDQFFKDNPNLSQEQQGVIWTYMRDYLQRVHAGDVSPDARIPGSDIKKALADAGLEGLESIYG